MQQARVFTTAVEALTLRALCVLRGAGYYKQGPIRAAGDLHGTETSIGPADSTPIKPSPSQALPAARATRRVPPCCTFSHGMTLVVHRSPRSRRDCTEFCHRWGAGCA